MNCYEFRVASSCGVSSHVILRQHDPSNVHFIGVGNLVCWCSNEKPAVEATQLVFPFLVPLLLPSLSPFLPGCPLFPSLVSVSAGFSATRSCATKFSVRSPLPSVSAQSRPSLFPSLSPFPPGVPTVFLLFSYCSPLVSPSFPVLS